MFKKIVAIFLCISAMTCIFTGCSNLLNISQPDEYKEYNYEEEHSIQSEQDESGILNKRQMKILMQEGLPTDYNKLTDTQKKSIERIEELLQYLDNKYDCAFSYLGYSSGGVLEEEWLEAYPDTLNSSYPCKVYVDEEGNIADTGNEAFVRCEVNRLLKNELNDHIDTEIKIYTECQYNGTEIVDGMGQIAGNTIVYADVFVEGKDQKNNLEKLADYAADWYKKYQINGSVNFIMVDEDYFPQISISNYSHTKIENNTEISLTCDIDKNGNVKIY